MPVTVIYNQKGNSGQEDLFTTINLYRRKLCFVFNVRRQPKTEAVR